MIDRSVGVAAHQSIPSYLNFQHLPTKWLTGFQRVSAGFSWFQHMKDITDITNIIAAANAAIDQRSQRSQSSRWILWLLAVASYGCFGLLTAETEADLQAQMGKQLSDGYNLLNAESV